MSAELLPCRYLTLPFSLQIPSPCQSLHSRFPLCSSPDLRWRNLLSSSRDLLKHLRQNITSNRSTFSLCWAVLREAEWLLRIREYFGSPGAFFRSNIHHTLALTSTRSRPVAPASASPKPFNLRESPAVPLCNTTPYEMPFSLIF